MARTRHGRRIRTNLLVSAALAAIPLAVPLPTTHGASVGWTGGSGDWSVGSNWSTSNPPAAADDAVFLTQNDATNRLVTLDSAANTAFALAQLQVDATGAGTMTLLLPAGSSNTLTVTGSGSAGREYIGYSGTGFFAHSGGTNTVTSLLLGYQSSGLGTYTMNNAAARLNATSESVGYQATGTTSGGTLTQAGGVFNQNAGTHTIAGAFGAGLTIGYASGSTGAFSLSGGSVNVTDSFSTASVGVSGTGTFTQTGGSFSVGRTLSLGSQASGIGVYTLNSPSANLSSQYQIVGVSATGITSGGTLTQAGGTFNHQAGSNTLSANLTIGGSLNSTGVYNLSGGNLSVGALEYIGFTGNGAFVQTDGTHTASGGIALGYNSSGVGTYTLNGAGAVLQINGSMDVGGGNAVPGGKGVLNISAGTMSMTGPMRVWNGAGTSSVTISGGVLNGPAIAVGGAGAGSGLVTVAGGAVSVTGVTVAAGGAFHYNGGSLAATSLAISGGTVSVGAPGDRVLLLNALTFAGTTNDWSGQLDLTDNDAILRSSDANRVGDTARITNQLKQGLNATTNSNTALFWTGQGIVTSSGWKGGSNYTGIGVTYNDFAAVGQPSAPIYTSFDGQAAGVNDVLAKYTWFGDADLNGQVNSNDYFQIDTGFLAGRTGWINGDFDYNGVINSNDYFLIDSAFLAQGSTILSPAGARLSGVAAVPEPASLGVIAFAGAALMARRRPRRRD